MKFSKISIFVLTGLLTFTAAASGADKPDYLKRFETYLQAVSDGEHDRAGILLAELAPGWPKDSEKLIVSINKASMENFGPSAGFETASVMQVSPSLIVYDHIILYEKIPSPVRTVFYRNTAGWQLMHYEQFDNLAEYVATVK